MTLTELRAKLDRFPGGGPLTPHPIAPNVLLSEGMVFMCDATEAHWLADAIASHRHDPRAKKAPYQVWTLDVDLAKRRGVLTMSADLDPTPVIVQELPFTDFPFAQIKVLMVREWIYSIMLLSTED